MCGKKAPKRKRKKFRMNLIADADVKRGSHIALYRAAPPTTAATLCRAVLAMCRTLCLLQLVLLLPLLLHLLSMNITYNNNCQCSNKANNINISNGGSYALTIANSMTTTISRTYMYYVTTTCHRL